MLFGKERWFIEMFYPLFQSGREHSALALGGSAYSDGQVEASPSLRHRSIDSTSTNYRLVAGGLVPDAMGLHPT